MSFATRITTADNQSLTVVSQTSAVTDWASRYLVLWWTAADVDPGAPASGPASMHPTQKQKVTDALLAGDRAPLWKKSGAEMKPQFFPDQLESWLGLSPATEGHAVGILFPGIAPETEPALTPAARGVTDADFFGSATEDRYPDVFGLLPPETSNQDLIGRLARLPHQALTMNHDPEASTAVLLEAARTVL
ncbi:hypothetical protein [Streptomyces sp. BE230]|uniref:hypothetical protein n=1 Tax=Streptomyces sp. BE230 TaxID=3002526 RepID=UPI002ED54EE1|nr:hypothetical protein [Streptomyces sp. BE230]